MVHSRFQIDWPKSSTDSEWIISTPTFSVKAKLVLLIQRYWELKLIISTNAFAAVIQDFKDYWPPNYCICTFQISVKSFFCRSLFSVLIFTIFTVTIYLFPLVLNWEVLLQMVWFLVRKVLSIVLSLVNLGWLLWFWLLQFVSHACIEHGYYIFFSENLQLNSY